MSRRRPPNKYSVQKAHDMYGIEKWCKYKFNLNSSEAVYLAEKFSEKEGENITEKNYPAIARFVQHRFNSFCSFVGRTMKKLNELEITENNAQNITENQRAAKESGGVYVTWNENLLTGETYISNQLQKELDRAKEINKQISKVEHD